MQPFLSVAAAPPVYYLARPYFYTNLYDRLTIRPALSVVEKKWICLQLLDALSFCGARGLCHGDLKVDNVLLTSWNWAIVADFAPFKPAQISEV